MSTPRQAPSGTGSIFTTSDLRLTRLLTRRGKDLATVNEYATASGIPVSAVLHLLAPHVDNGVIDLEMAGGQVFVHTAPSGRPGTDGKAQPEPNLWETLRDRYDRGHAYAAWCLTRELEAGGWAVEADPRRIPPTSSGERTPVGLRIGMAVLPLIALMPPDMLNRPTSPLTDYDTQGLPAVGLTCAEGMLDPFVTSVRAWMLTRYARTGMHVLILEEPRYSPVIVSPNDSAITPRSVSMGQLPSLLGQREHASSSRGLQQEHRREPGRVRRK